MPKEQTSRFSPARRSERSVAQSGPRACPNFIAANQEGMNVARTTDKRRRMAYTLLGHNRLKAPDVQDHQGSQAPRPASCAARSPAECRARCQAWAGGCRGKGAGPPGQASRLPRREPVAGCRVGFERLRALAQRLDGLETARVVGQYGAGHLARRLGAGQPLRMEPQERLSLAEALEDE
jgi:hypothetical protein